MNWKYVTTLGCLILSCLVLSACDENKRRPVDTGTQKKTLAKPRRTEIPPPTTLSATPAHLPEFIAFESGQVRPLALSPDGTRLYSVNTPNNSVEVFAVEGDNLRHLDTVAVGLEPVALAVHGDEVWVVNHLSDSVSIIDISLTPSRVINTLQVGDEPRDIVFAGRNFDRAFITTAHRGQNSPVSPRLTTPGIGRADVWVFDSQAIGSEFGGTPLTIVTLFGDTPRALAVTPDGSKVYAAIFNSGNRTTVIHQVETADKAAPMANIEGIEAPKTGHILQFREGHWRDEQDKIFSEAGLNLPDYDVFTLDATADKPVVTAKVSGVGTTLFNMAVNPVNGQLYVSNTNARNHVRFEGPGNNSSTVRQHFVESRISIVQENEVLIRNLNPHVSPTQAVVSPEEKRASVATPLQMAPTRDGKGLYLAAMGSNKISRYDIQALSRGDWQPLAQQHIEVTGGGPTGIVLDSQEKYGYVLTRFDNGLSVLDLADGSERRHIRMYNPEPESITAGRPFLYDATLTSNNGTSSCAGCHVFADTDHLSWDLGNPDDVVKADPHPEVPFSRPTTGSFIERQATFHPMKGPKSTQSFRGMANHGPLHWRGDRTGMNPVAGETQEAAAFKEFNGAFEGLVGRDAPLAADQMQAFTDFAMRLSYPPNPLRPLDNQLTGDLAEGHRVYTELATSGDFETKDGENLGCNSCHVLEPEKGHYGSSVTMVAVLGNNNQDFKTPHFRNLYQKVGFFREGPHMPQIRGFGFSQNGATPSMMELLRNEDFTFETPTQRKQLADFLFAYDTLLAPIVGQQVTLTKNSPSAAHKRLTLLMERAQVAGDLPECDLIVQGVWGGERRAAFMLASDQFQSDRKVEVYDKATLLSLAQELDNHLTFMCVPPNSGVRIALDRDLDGVYNGD